MNQNYLKISQKALTYFILNDIINAVIKTLPGAVDLDDSARSILVNDELAETMKIQLNNTTDTKH
jgi:hypothetical protein